MFRPMLVVAALLLAGVAPLVDAQYESPSEGWVLIGDDPEDDNELTVEGSEVQESPYEPSDLTGLSILENDGGFHFLLDVKGFEEGDDQTDPFLATYFYDVFFNVHDRTWRVDLRFSNGEESEITAYLYETDPEYGWFDFVDEINATIDAEDTTFGFLIPHDMLQDQRGKQARPGDMLTDFWASVQVSDVQTIYGLAESTDRMPDSGAFPTRHEVVTGTVSTGHIEAFSETPVRISNGEATTFLFEVEVTNNGDFLDTVIPSWEGGLESWIVTFPEGNVRLDPQEKKVIPFLVTVPFVHQHGVYYPFIVTFQSQSDPLAAGQVELGVRYTAVPQPAGHHPTVYLHDAENRPFINTIQGQEYPEGAEDEGVGETTGGGSCSTSSGGVSGRGMIIPLSPNLGMGVDVDLDLIGEAEWIIGASEPTSGYTFKGYIVVDDQRPSSCAAIRAIPDNSIALVEPTEAIELAQGETATYSSAIRPMGDGDPIPYEDGMQMWLAIAMMDPEGSNQFFSGPSAGQFGEPYLMDDTSFTLPLEEYHDDVDEHFDRLTGLDIYSHSGQQRYVNPGELIFYQVTAQNIGALPAEFNVELTGSNVEWAYVIDDVNRLKLKPGDAQEIIIVVQAPESAADGDLSDLTLLMTHREEDSIRSLIRLLSEVDTDEDHEDETEKLATLSEDIKESSSPFLAIALALAGLVAVVRRRN